MCCRLNLDPQDIAPLVGDGFPFDIAIRALAEE
jgi:hypothetical protein